jgi:hypothetical protein
MAAARSPPLSTPANKKFVAAVSELYTVLNPLKRWGDWTLNDLRIKQHSG